MIWLCAALAVGVVVATVVLAVGGGTVMGPPQRDRPASDLSGPIGVDQLRTVRFPVVARGYRMADVDALLSALADQMDSQAAGEAPGEAADEAADRAAERSVSQPASPGETADSTGLAE